MKAQTGQRLYLRFNDVNSTNPVNYYGMRIKRNVDNTKYWVLGRGMSGLNSTGVALIDPTNPIGTPPTYHTHYFTLQTPYVADIAYASDFDLNGAGSLSGAGTIEISSLRSQPSPTSQALSLFGVNSTANLPLVPGNSFDYHMPTRREVLGSALRYDATSPLGICYAVAWNLLDPATAGGTNFRDWGVASINAANMTVNWSHTWTGAAANQWEDVRDIAIKLIGTQGYYVTCGMRMDVLTGRRSGLITSVNRNNGNLVYQRTVNPPAGFDLELNSISIIPVPLGAEYIVVGTLFPISGGGMQKQVFIARLNFVGTVIWSYSLRLSNGDDAEAFRHCIMNDTTMVIAGRVTHQNGAPTSGMLVKVSNPNVDLNNTGCDAGNTPLIQWWKTYDTYDPAQGGDPTYPNVNVELIDVTLLTANSPNRVDVLNDVAAVGTADMTHSNTLIKDVLWMETTTTIGGGSGINRDMRSNSPFGDYCRYSSPDYDCERIFPTITNITPEETESFQRAQTAMDTLSDDSYRFCDNTNPSPAWDGSNAKRSVYVNYGGIAVDAEALSRRVAVLPLPVFGDALQIQVTIDIPDRIQILLYDVQGHRVQQSSIASLRAGTHSFSLDCRDLCSGLYSLRVETSIFTKSVLIPIIR
jgi:hypothetical protein